MALTAPFCAAATPDVPTAEPRDWRDEILYFVMIDRFEDGDRTNNDQGHGEYDPADPRKFSGGDLSGIRKRLDYIRGLGATAIWITPPVENQWWSLNAQFSGYHGYWTRDFRAVDPHFGTLRDYRALADAMRGHGLRLVQDIVVNHTGDWFGYDGAYDPADPAHGFVLRPHRDGSTAPAAPFHRNDARDPAQRAAGWYHWTPRIRDFGVREQELDWQLADLDDLNTEHPDVRRALREAYAYWIREVGVDGFRVDTAFYVPPEFFADFLHSENAEAPGVLRVAQAAGKHDFHVFGEGWGIDRAGEDTMARKIESYVRAADGSPLLPGMINFPLYGTLGDVFARGRPPAELGDRIERMMRVHADPWRMPTFVDNHDVDRFLSGGDTKGLRQALLAIMTLPGIPTIYYGTEQGVRAQRPAMFAGGVESGGRDWFDAEAPLYRDIRRMAALRRGERTLSRGVPTVLWANTAAPGPVAWRMDHAGHSVLVVMNTATHTALLDGLETGVDTDSTAGTPATPLFALEGDPPPLRPDAAGRVSLVLPPGAGYVWAMRTPTHVRSAGALGGESGSNDSGTGSGRTDSRTPMVSARHPGNRDSGIPTRVPPDSAGSGMASNDSGTPIDSGIDSRTPMVSAPTDSGTPTFLGTLPSVVRDDLQLHGIAPGARRVQVVVDGDLQGAQQIPVAADGHWQAQVATDDMIDPALTHRLVIRNPETGEISAPHIFRVQRDWRLVADIADPADDDHGPEGTYLYPDDPIWRDRRPADLLGARVWTSGDALRLQLRMRHISTVWKPVNGFDHVAFTVFIELPGRGGGARTMPQQQAALPEDLRWHRRLRAHGWSNVLFSDDGADASQEGTVLPAAARIETDAEAGTVSFTLPAQALGGPLAGARLHIVTWDYDGGYRPLAPDPGGDRFGGGATDAAKTMDTMTVVLPRE